VAVKAQHARDGFQGALALRNPDDPFFGMCATCGRHPRYLIFDVNHKCRFHVSHPDVRKDKAGDTVEFETFWRGIKASVLARASLGRLPKYELQYGGFAPVMSSEFAKPQVIKWCGYVIERAPYFPA
jgi:hypothetical protein